MILNGETIAQWAQSDFAIRQFGPSRIVVRLAHLNPSFRLAARSGNPVHTYFVSPVSPISMGVILPRSLSPDCGVPEQAADGRLTISLFLSRSIGSALCLSLLARRVVAPPHLSVCGYRRVA